jgi:methylated-DNA-protein-cysteine methyltransferase-like protein
LLQLATHIHGKLGHIAKLAGKPNYSRHVGQGEQLDCLIQLCAIICVIALKFLPSNTNPPIPWHRVIAASGTISSRGPGTDGARRQRDALVAEGVDVVQGRSGEFRVDLGRFGWFPPVHEAGLRESEDEDEDEMGTNELAPDNVKVKDI